MGLTQRPPWARSLEAWAGEKEGRTKGGPGTGSRAGPARAKGPRAEPEACAPEWTRLEGQFRGVLSSLGLGSVAQPWPPAKSQSNAQLELAFLSSRLCCPVRRAHQGRRRPFPGPGPPSQAPHRPSRGLCPESGSGSAQPQWRERLLPAPGKSRHTALGDKKKQQWKASPLPPHPLGLPLGLLQDALSPGHWAPASCWKPQLGPETRGGGLRKVPEPAPRATRDPTSSFPSSWRQEDQSRPSSLRPGPGFQGREKPPCGQWRRGGCTRALLLTGAGERQKAGKPNPSPAGHGLLSLGGAWWHWQEGGEGKDRQDTVPGSSSSRLGSSVCLGHLQLGGTGWGQPPCTLAWPVSCPKAGLLYLFSLHSRCHQLPGPPGPAWGRAPASSGACLLLSPDSGSRTPCSAGPAAKTQPESSREGDGTAEDPEPGEGASLELVGPGPRGLSPPCAGATGSTGVCKRACQVPQQDSGSRCSCPCSSLTSHQRGRFGHLKRSGEARATPAGPSPQPAHFGPNEASFTDGCPALPHAHQPRAAHSVVSAAAPEEMAPTSRWHPQDLELAHGPPEQGKGHRLLHSPRPTWLSWDPHCWSRRH